MSFDMVSFFDSTFLKTQEDSGFSEEEYLCHIQSFVMEAIDYKFKLVMIRSDYIVFAKEIISINNSNVLVGTVIDFPYGISSTKSKLYEINNAINLGADDIDVVVNYMRFKQGDYDYIVDQVKKCTELCFSHNKTIKWIIESAALSENEIIDLCKLIRDVVLNNFNENYFQNIFIKSSTGYYNCPNSKPNGATVSAIKLMVKNSFPLAVKASGGVRNFKDFDQMINLGVKRIGTSSALSILNSKQSYSNY
tara:strand:- start:11369 stop:12118 length:750 start_codon:yes stop_codon:yes gene_type:complete